MRALARGRTVSSMRTLTRIVLSTLLLTLLACDPNPAADADPMPDESADGIGTSPSDPDPERLMAAGAVDGSLTPMPCGVWTGPTVELADVDALACVPADAVFFTAGEVTCSDAVRFALSRPGRAVARRLDYQLRAVEADCTP